MPQLTLMAVHAHPDDEAISTGGILARYAKEGVRTVLVTCTDGGCGDGPGGVKPGEDGFDRDSVVAERMEELRHSCAVLGIEHLEILGYPDSGMMGWPQNDEPGSFWSTPVDQAAARLSELMEQYQPQVVVTYNADGFYGHPDHIQAHRITMAAAETTGIPDKVYFTAVPRSRMAELGRRLQELGLSLDDNAAEAEPDGAEPDGPKPDGPKPDEAAEPPATAAGPQETAADPPTGEGEEGAPPGPREEWGTPDEEVTTYVDVSGVTDQKFDSLMAHASQADNIFFVKMGRDVFSMIMGTESFVRAVDRSGAPIPEDDLFAGLR